MTTTKRGPGRPRNADRHRMRSIRMRESEWAILDQIKGEQSWPDFFRKMIYQHLTTQLEGKTDA